MTFDPSTSGLSGTNLYITTSNNQILTTTIITGGDPSYTAKLINPMGIAMDADHDVLYVADVSSIVVLSLSNGSLLTTWSYPSVLSSA